MQRGHKIEHAPALDMPDRFDPSGVPYLDPGHARPRATTAHRRHHPHALPGLHPTSVIASVEEVAAQGEGEWLIWGSVGNRPVLFAVQPRVAAEMLESLAAGETPTAIIEPWQLVGERLD